MKRILSIVLFISLLFCLVACGGSSEPKDSGRSDVTSQTQNNSSAKEDKPSADNEDAKSEKSSSGDLGDYYVEIKGAACGEDYEGKPIIVITYSWTNNSDETKSPMWTISEKAFQDGVQLDRPIIVDSDIYESGTSSKEVRPGTTVEVQCAFIMTSESVVEFEMTELISFSKEIVAMDFDPTAL